MCLVGVLTMGKVVINQRGFAEIVSPGGIVDRGIAKGAGRTRDRAKRNITAAGLVDKGALRQSVQSQRLAQTKRSVTYRVGSDQFYAHWTHEGNGPGRIYPRVAKALRFKPKGQQLFVFAKSVKSFPGVPWLKRAVKELRTSDFG